jgi:6-phosphofructokinase 1
MDTINKVCAYAGRRGYELRAVGIPKTVDNDLAGTDHCPGYGSVAKHIAAITMGVGLDMRSVHLTDPVIILEVMGRNAGWMTASSALARRQEGDAPNLVYVPEAPWNKQRFLADVRETYATHGWCFIAVSVGTKDDSGEYLAAQTGTFATDAFGHVQLGGVGPFLDNIILEELGLKARPIRMGPAERVAMHFASLTDRDEAYGLGAFAVRSAIEGVTAKMVSLVRESDEPYRCGFGLTDLDVVANEEKLIPREWLNEAGNDVTGEFLDYACPLIQGEVPTPIEDGLPRYARLRRVPVGKKLPEWPTSAG